MKSPATLDLGPEAVPGACLLEVEVVTAFTMGGPEFTSDEVAKVTLGFDVGKFKSWRRWFHGADSS